MVRVCIYLPAGDSVHLLLPIAPIISNIDAGIKNIPKLKMLIRLTENMKTPPIHTNVFPKRGLFWLKIKPTNPRTPIKHMGRKMRRASLNSPACIRLILAVSPVQASRLLIMGITSSTGDKIPHIAPATPIFGTVFIA
jgi:hypothetical protein